MRTHIALPALQIAVAAFFASPAHAQVCVDESSVLVDKELCDGTQPKGSFYLVPEVAEPGSVTVSADAERIDSADKVARAAAGIPAADLVVGGLGRREDCDPKKEDCDDGGARRPGRIPGGRGG